MLERVKASRKLEAEQFRAWRLNQKFSEFEDVCESFKIDEDEGRSSVEIEFSILANKLKEEEEDLGLDPAALLANRLRDEEEI